MSVAAAVSALAGVPGPVTTVEEWNGLPTFMVNGRPHMSTSFETYVPEEFPLGAASLLPGQNAVRIELVQYHRI